MHVFLSARSVFLAAPMTGFRGHVERDALSSSFFSRIFLNAPPHLTDLTYGGFDIASNEREFLNRGNFYLSAFLCCTD